MVNDILKIHGWRHWPVLTFGGQESTRRMKTRSKRATVAKRRDTTLHQLHYTRGSFQTSHGRADYAGLLEEKILLIVTDAYLKWLEVKPVTAANSIVTIDHLRNMLATHSLPKTLVTDNRTQFTRLQRWLLLLAAYHYDIEFRSTRAHGNADALSHLPLPVTEALVPSETKRCNIRKIKALPVTSKQIYTATQRDPTLSKVKRYVLRGWPETVPKSLKAYYSKLAELSIKEGCLLWGGRVVIPPSLMEIVKAELHKEHLGIAKMKALAWNHVWWSEIDKDLESLVKSCQDRAAVKQAPAKVHCILCILGFGLIAPGRGSTLISRVPFRDLDGFV